MGATAGGWLGTITGYRIPGSDSQTQSSGRKSDDHGSSDAGAPPRSIYNPSIAESDDEPDNNLSGLLRAIAAGVSAQGASAADGIRAAFAMRIAGAQRSGLSAAQIAAAIVSLKEEMQATLAASAQNHALESSGRIAAAIMQHRRPPRRDHDSADRSRHGLALKRNATTRAAKVKSFKAAAKAALASAPSAPVTRRRRGGRGGGLAGFHRTARTLVFRPPRLPSHAYDPTLAYLADTLHWLELWDDPGMATEESRVESNLQNLLSPSL